MNMNGLSVADFGCGFNASFIRSILGNVKHAFVVDVALADDLKKESPHIRDRRKAAGCIEKSGRSFD